MNAYFECKVSFEKMGENGLNEKVTEPYLVDALSFTEAEERICKEVQPFVTGEFIVSKIRRTKIAELFFNDGGDKWYRCKINYIILDEEKCIEKKTAQIIMVQATDLPDAIKVLIDRMQDSLGSYEIVAVTETDIIDVLPFQTQLK